MYFDLNSRFNASKSLSLFFYQYYRQLPYVLLADKGLPRSLRVWPWPQGGSSGLRTVHFSLHYRPYLIAPSVTFAMAKHVEEVVPSTPEDEEVEEVDKKKKSKGKADDGKSASGDEDAEDGEEDGEEEEEYEIESILDAKRGYFQNVRFIYWRRLSFRRVAL